MMCSRDWRLMTKELFAALREFHGRAGEIRVDNATFARWEKDYFDNLDWGGDSPLYLGRHKEGERGLRFLGVPLVLGCERFEVVPEAATPKTVTYYAGAF